MKQLYSGEFKIINTEEKAYFLGFFHADGGLHLGKSGGYAVKIKLAIKDKEILDRFVKKFPFFKVTLTQDYYEWKGKRKISKKCQLLAYNKTMFLDLLALNIKNNIPDLPDKLMIHFLRGVIDGDGSWGVQSRQLNKTTGKCVKYYGMTLCVNNQLVFNKVSNFLNKYDINPTIRKVNPILIMRIRKKKELLKLIDILYEDAFWYLNRKKKIIQEIQDYLVPNKSDKLLGTPEEDNQAANLRKCVKVLKLGSTTNR